MKKKIGLLLVMLSISFIKNNIKAELHLFHHPDDISLTAIISDTEIKTIRIEHVLFNNTYRILPISTIDISNQNLSKNILFAWNPNKKSFAATLTKNKVNFYDVKQKQYKQPFCIQLKYEIKNIIWENENNLLVEMNTGNQIQVTRVTYNNKSC